MNAGLIKCMLGSGPKNQIPARRNSERAPRNLQSIFFQSKIRNRRTRNAQPATRNSQLATRNSIFLFLSLLFLSFVFPGTGTFAAGLDQKQEAFKETVYRLSSFADRSTGTAGNQAAAAYIKERLERLGFETVGTHKFAVPVIRDEKSTLTIPGPQFIDFHSTAAGKCRNASNHSAARNSSPPGLHRQR